jgi:hypothetical protein
MSVQLDAKELKKMLTGRDSGGISIITVAEIAVIGGLAYWLWKKFGTLATDVTTLIEDVGSNIGNDIRGGDITNQLHDGANVVGDTLEIFTGGKPNPASEIFKPTRPDDNVLSAGVNEYVSNKNYYEHGWRLCYKCACLFYDDGKYTTNCARSGKHEPMNNTPYYVLQLQHAHIKKDDGISIYNLTNPFRWLDKLDNATQPDAMFPLDDDFNRDGNVWEWCYKCGLVVNTNKAKGMCYDNGDHQVKGRIGESKFQMFYKPNKSDQYLPQQQNGWARCTKCQGFFYKSETKAQFCAGNNKKEHVQEDGDIDYVVVYTTDKKDIATAKKEAEFKAPVWIQPSEDLIHLRERQYDKCLREGLLPRSTCMKRYFPGNSAPAPAAAAPAAPAQAPNKKTWQLHVNNFDL